MAVMLVTGAFGLVVFAFALIADRMETRRARRGDAPGPNDDPS